MSNAETLRQTPLHADHVAAGARMVGFAGFDMPVQYSDGIIAEHMHCRESAGLFDVSHMGQAELVGPDFETVARALEAIIPADVLNIKPGRQKYSQLLTGDGGIIDDLMFARPPASDGRDDRILLVVNASRMHVDFAHISAMLPDNIELRPRPDLALIALQGPMAEAVMSSHIPDIADTMFMDVFAGEIAGSPVVMSRSGYTGEDGFEISMPATNASTVWQALLADERVKPIGLGARDTLRLEAGLCLYGADINSVTTPGEAGLKWSIPKRRREEKGFPGADAVCRELAHGPLRKRVGLLIDGKIPVRAGATLFETDESEIAMGFVTSGGKVPTIDQPIAMAYVPTNISAIGTELFADVRGKRIRVEITPLPFTPARFKRANRGK